MEKKGEKRGGSSQRENEVGKIVRKSNSSSQGKKKG